ncbi:MAG: hypothetical protein C4543_03995 [Ignavibacteriales bacterium]|jgi:uncharacterized membrane-anchored protein YhcB (DUF1043 family)|nr:MAG: hypothetical protein C4543_03995 [Ignavibacteriales bacterium]
MDLIPQIATVIIYILIALIIVICFSYLFARFSDSNRKPEDENLHEKRKHIREYINNHNRQLTSKNLTKNKNVIVHTYSAPTFSRKTAAQHDQPKENNVTVTSSRNLSPTANKPKNIRYIIVNNKKCNESRITNIRIVTSLKNTTLERRSYHQ